MSNTDQAKELAKYRPDTKPFKATDYPFYWISLTSNRYAHNMEIYLKKKGLTITSWRTLMLLKYQGPCSVTEIANHAASRMPTITRTVYKIRDQELVEIYQQEADARVTMVKITETGAKLIDEVLASSSRMFDHIYDGLSDGQLRLLNETLERLFNNMPPTSI